MKKETTAPRPQDQGKNPTKSSVPQKPETPTKNPSKEQKTWPDEVDVNKTRPTIPDIESGKQQHRDQPSRDQQSRDPKQTQRTTDQEEPEEGTTGKDPRTGNWK